MFGFESINLNVMKTKCDLGTIAISWNSTIFAQKILNQIKAKCEQYI